MSWADSFLSPGSLGAFSPGQWIHGQGQNKTKELEGNYQPQSGYIAAKPKMDMGLGPQRCTGPAFSLGWSTCGLRGSHRQGQDHPAPEATLTL